MIINKNAYVNIEKEVVEYSRDLISKDELASFSQHIESKLLNFKPTLMIYGTYNAGKSTLLNALFGQDEMAKTGDAPETKEVHEYKYNGYTIFDTPGLNARSEDNIVTKEHLSKSEVIIFVLSTNGSLEEDYVYTKISEIVKANKPIIIVLNNKNGIDSDSIEAKKLMIKVGENLRKIGDRKNIENIETKVNLCMVNAKTALKAKLNNKNILLKRSDILQLENMIEKLLETSGNKEVINTLNIYIQKFIYSLIDKIDNKIDKIEVRKIEELITYLEKSKQNSENKLKTIVNKKMLILVDNITTMLLSGTSQDKINSYISTIINKINNQAMEIYINIENDLKTKIDDFSQDFQNISAEYDDIAILDTEEEVIEKDSMISDDIKSKIGDTLKNKDIMKEGATQILIKAKDWLPKEVMLGKGSVWINKAAGKAAIGVSVAIEAYNIYSANKEHQQMIQEERNRILGAKNSAEKVKDEIQSSLFSSIDEVIMDTFNDLIIGFKSASKKLNNNNGSLLENKEKLQSVLNKL